MGDAQLDLIAAVRRFNRFYTRQIGLFEETLTRSQYTLAEARVLFELGHRTGPAPPDPGGERGLFTRVFHTYVRPAASEIADELRLDPAYLTRILRKFATSGRAGFVQTGADPHHSFGKDLVGQTWELALTPLVEDGSTLKL